MIMDGLITTPKATGPTSEFSFSPDENHSITIDEDHHHQISADFSIRQETSNHKFGLPILAIFQIIFFIILCLLGSFINSIVFWIFNRRPALRSLSNRFVLSLVTVNLFISSIISPLILVETVLSSHAPNSCVSEVISTVSNAVIFIGIFSTLLIAMDRYCAVTSPLHYSMTITRSRSQIMIIVTWIIGILLALPHFFICIFLKKWRDSSSSLNLNLISATIQFSLAFAFPFIALCWLYWRMYTAAHRNSERTRKHSISGELLTVLDGSTSVIPQGIDFLTHYMNPFTKTPMIGSVLPVGGTSNTGTGIIITTAVKKPRRRSSNGSSSSLLFREEGRAIKTAFFVLGTFLLCWTPHFTLILISGISSEPCSGYDRTDPLINPIDMKYGCWDGFLSTTGILLSSILHPFIYVFRNKMACKELTKLLCGYVLEQRKQDLIKYSHNNNHQSHNNHYGHHQQSNGSNSGDRVISYPSEDYNDDPPTSLHSPPVILPKTSPRRSSMKSLTPQSSLNSTSTHVNLIGPGSSGGGGYSNNDSSSSSTESPIILMGTENIRPPFLRSVTLPEQPRVKFPPNLIKQKSTVHRTVSGPPTASECEDFHFTGQRSNNSSSRYQENKLLEVVGEKKNSGRKGGSRSPVENRRSKFSRQDSICSILSNDSVLMISCADDSTISTTDIRICSNTHKISHPNTSPRLYKTRRRDSHHHPHPYHQHHHHHHHLPNYGGHYPYSSSSIEEPSTSSLPFLLPKFVNDETGRDSIDLGFQSNTVMDPINEISSSSSHQCIRQDSNYSNQTIDSGIGLYEKSCKKKSKDVKKKIYHQMSLVSPLLSESVLPPLQFRTPDHGESSHLYLQNSGMRVGEFLQTSI